MNIELANGRIIKLKYRDAHTWVVRSMFSTYVFTLFVLQIRVVLCEYGPGRFDPKLFQSK